MQNLHKILFALLLCSAAGLRADHYVAQNGQQPEWPFTNMTTAASNIQDAVNAAVNGAVVWVDDGEYYTPPQATVNLGTNVVSITNAITLRSINGPAAAIINGGGSNRCVDINVAAASCAFGPAVLDGFTLTNGYSYIRGGGIQVYGYAVGTGIVQNCVISGNVIGKATEYAYAGGGGIFSYNSVGFSPVISNCLVRGNRSFNLSSLTNVAGGGGLWFRALGLVVDCTFTENETENVGGGIYLNVPRSVVDRCVVVSNTAIISGGGIYQRGISMDLRNCLVTHNSAPSGSGLFIYSTTVAPVYNCTFMSNRFQFGSSVLNGDMQNNIIEDMIVSAGTTVTGYNNCLSSMPAYGEWNNTIVTTNNPGHIGFVDTAAGNFRLIPASPCVNAGANQLDWLGGARDLDRHRRIDRFSGTPDIGCYEYIHSGSLFGLR